MDDVHGLGKGMAFSIGSERVLLGKARDADAACVVEIQLDEQVRRYLGGIRPEPEVREAIATGGLARLTVHPGSYVVDRFTDAMLGTMVLSRPHRDAVGEPCIPQRREATGFRVVGTFEQFDANRRWPSRRCTRSRGSSQMR